MITKEQFTKLENSNKIIKEFIEEARNLINIYNSLAKESRNRLKSKIQENKMNLTNTHYVFSSYRNNKRYFELKRDSVLGKGIILYDIDSELELNSLKFEEYKEEKGFEFSYWVEKTIYSCGEMDGTEIEQIFLYIPKEWFSSNKAEELIKEFLKNKEDESWNEILKEEQKGLEEKMKRDKANQNFEEKRKEVLSSEDYKEYLKLKQHFEKFEYTPL